MAIGLAIGLALRVARTMRDPVLGLRAGLGLKGTCEPSSGSVLWSLASLVQLIGGQCIQCTNPIGCRAGRRLELNELGQRV